MLLKQNKKIRTKRNFLVPTLFGTLAFSLIFIEFIKRISIINPIVIQELCESVKFTEEENESAYPLTSPANLDDKYINWSIPEETKKKLWKSIIKAPLNEKTGRHTIIFSIANAGMINFIINSLCSMQLIGIPKNHRITVALDEETYRVLLKINEPVVLLNSNFTKRAVNNKQIHDFYNIIKVKPTILHQFLLWNVEPITVDADTVFLKNPFHLFNDEADFEVQCDSKEFYQIPSNMMPVPWQVNLGFFKVRPSKTVMKFLPIWLLKMYNAPKNAMQSMLRRALKPYETYWINNDTVIVNTTTLLGSDYPNLTFRFLDPMLVTNAGGLYLDGAKAWKSEAKRRNIDKPEMIHFFHLGKNDWKMSLIRRKNLIFYNKDHKCLDKFPKGAIDFKTWK